MEPHSFLVVCKDVSCRGRWNAEVDAMDYNVYDRITPTKSGEHSLVHFDGATHHTYRTPPKAWETVYCRREPTPFECSYLFLDPEMELHDYVIGDEEKSSFKIEWIEDKGKSVVTATVDIPKGSYIMPQHLASSFVISNKSWDNLKHNTEVVGKGEVKIIEYLLDFIDEYGHPSNAEGLGLNYVEVGGSFLIRESEDESEANIGRWVPSHPSGKRPVYSPVYERHRLSFDLFLVATRDIKAGEEIVKHEDMWSE